MKVLHVSHTSTVGGGERSLLELLTQLPPEIQSCAACPPGALADALETAGFHVFSIPAFEQSLRLTAREAPNAIATLARTARSVRLAAARSGADVVSANSIRAGLIAIACGRPLVVQVRDCLPDGLLSRLTRRLLARRAQLLVANSAYTLHRFGGGRGQVLYPPVDIQRFAGVRRGKAEARRTLGLDPSVRLLGVIAQITPWKGQLELVEALAGLSGTELLIVGGVTFSGDAVRFDNDEYLECVRATVKRRGLEHRVHFLGDRRDIPTVMAALDVLLVPSWEEPFGRVVLEGLAAGLPVIATAVGGPAEIIEDGLDGLLVPPRDPKAWADAIRQVLDDQALAERLATNAVSKAHAPRFDARRHGEAAAATFVEVARAR